MASGTISDGAIGIGFPHAVALFAATGHGRRTFQLRKRMSRPPRTTRLICLGEVHLFGSQALLAIDRGPCGRSMPTPQELLIYILVAAPAITRTQPCGDDESVM